MGIGSALVNAGFVQEGIDKNALQQQQLQRGQQELGLGELKLNEAQRQFGNQKSVREAMAAADPETGLFGALLAKANQQKANGDDEGYQQTLQNVQQLGLHGQNLLAQGAVYGVPPDQVEQQIHQLFGSSRFVPGSLEYGTAPPTNPDGTPNPHAGHHFVRIIDAKTNLPITLDATQLMSMQQAPVTLKKDEMLVNPITKEPMLSNPSAGATTLGSTYMETGPNAGQVVTKGGPRVLNINRTNVGGNAPSKKSDLPVYNAIKSSMMNNPGMSTIDPATGSKVATPAAVQKLSLANQIYQANRDLDPQTVAAMAMNGTFGRSKSTGKRQVLYQGKLFDVADPTVDLTPAVAPTPQPSEEEDMSADNYANGGKVSYARGGRISSTGLC